MTRETPAARERRLTREEGTAARRFGLPDSRCPYPICDDRRHELRGYWMSGWAEENGRQRGGAFPVTLQGN